MRKRRALGSALELYLDEEVCQRIKAVLMRKHLQLPGMKEGSSQVLVSWGSGEAVELPVPVCLLFCLGLI
ncbi:hypothetical protein H920_09622 [Fukomys damarensis]|uniref:Uncharacterized protein n=1 Tax=Fukomys damarensis TaxID=885580 RepID=A0A091DD19_FUKDA|nr:hypothetical protein H920_09622 [Fukomys damarensis]